MGGIYIARRQTTCVDSFVDKAHYFLTVILLLFFCYLVGYVQIYGQPLSCIPPETYNMSASYLQDYCFATGTYVLEPAKEIMPGQDTASEAKKIYINYYQWLPYMFIIQAVCFYLPHLMWSQMQQMKTGVRFTHIVNKCKKARDATVEERNDQVKQTSKHRQNSGLGSFGLAGYIFSKLLNVCNVIAQICVLNFLVSGVALSSGPQVFLDAWKAVFYNQDGHFPPLSFCDTVVSNTQQYTVQCVLTANMMHEKMFLLLYVWFSVLLFASVLDFFYTTICFVFSLGYRYASRRYFKVLPNKERIEWSKFVNHQLGYDGLLLLHFIEVNAGIAMASDVACHLYDALRRSAVCDNIQHASDPFDDFMKMKPKHKVGRSIIKGCLTSEIDGCCA